MVVVVVAVVVVVVVVVDSSRIGIRRRFMFYGRQVRCSLGLAVGRGIASITRHVPRISPFSANHRSSYVYLVYHIGHCYRLPAYLYLYCCSTGWVWAALALGLGWRAILVSRVFIDRAHIDNIASTSISAVHPTAPFKYISSKMPYADDDSLASSSSSSP